MIRRLAVALGLSAGVVGIEWAITWYGPGWLSILFNIVLVAFLLMCARARSEGWADLGFSSQGVIRSLFVGGILSIVWIVVVVAKATTDPSVFSSADPPDGPLQLAVVLLRILVITAAAEEIVFRGVLQATWRRVVPIAGTGWGRFLRRLAPSLAVGVFFGLWHIGPTHDTLIGNDEELVLGAFVPSIIGTAASAMVFLGPLREWTRNLAGPILLHFVVNGSVIVAAYELGCPSSC